MTPSSSATSALCSSLSEDAASMVHFEPLSALWLDILLPIEEQAYAHPWTRGNFQDAMVAGYEIQLLVNGSAPVAGLLCRHAVLDEVHLLNITVNPAHQRQGWARVLLDALSLWARGKDAQWIWLEVRESNARAREVYVKHGFTEVGLRKNYYPNPNGPRENAVLMSLKLWP